MAKRVTAQHEGGAEFPRFFTVLEVAAALGVSARTVRERIAEGAIPAARVGSGRTLPIPGDFLRQLAKSASQSRRNAAA